MSSTILNISRAVAFSFFESSAKFSRGLPFGPISLGSGTWHALQCAPQVGLPAFHDFVNPLSGQILGQHLQVGRRSENAWLGRWISTRLLWGHRSRSRLGDAKCIGKQGSRYGWKGRKDSFKR